MQQQTTSLVMLPILALLEAAGAALLPPYASPQPCGFRMPPVSACPGACANCTCRCYVPSSGRDAIHRLFLRYKDADEEGVGVEGISQLCADLGVEPDDIVVLVLRWVLVLSWVLMLRWVLVLRWWRAGAGFVVAKPESLQAVQARVCQTLGAGAKPTTALGSSVGAPIGAFPNVELSAAYRSLAVDNFAVLTLPSATCPPPPQLALWRGGDVRVQPAGV